MIVSGANLSKFVYQQVMNMNNPILGLKQGWIVAILLTLGMTMNAQTSDQSRLFIGRSHVAIMKVEKEMYKANDNTNAADLKKAVKYQMIAVNLYKQNKLSEAVANSYKSRAICIELCNKMSISEGQFYNLNDDEQTFCTPASYSNLTLHPGKLTASQNKEVDELNVLDFQKFHQLELSVK